MSNIPSQELGPRPEAVRPFGRYGVGVITEQPAGLLIVAAVILMTLEAIPESWWFIAGTLVVGGVFGFALWLYHRR